MNGHGGLRETLSEIRVPFQPIPMKSPSAHDLSPVSICETD